MTPDDIIASHTERFGHQPALNLPTAPLHPSSTNPRKRFKPDKLAELAASIKKYGVLQPILARPSAAYREGTALPVYEIVAGECRWRASELAAEPSIPTLIRALSDFEVLEIQLLENLEREDLHPLEEAQGMQNLMHSTQGRLQMPNADALAQRLGKSRRWVYNRLALLNLSQEARDAFLGDQINASVAGLLARMHEPKQQSEALAHILKGWAGEPLSFRAAADWLQKTYMLKLSNARFDIQAVYTAAGPCSGCPKRSGANPDLFADVEGGDHCQDASCFEAKTDEAYERLLAQARAKGQTVLEGSEARSLMPNAKALPDGHQWLGKAAPKFTDSKRPLRELMGDNKAVVVLAHPGADMPVYIVPDAAVKKALKASGRLREEAPAPEAQPAAQPEAPPDRAVPVMKASKVAAPAPAPSTTPKPFTPTERAGRIDHLSGQLFCRRLAMMLTASLRSSELPLAALRWLAQERMADYGSVEGYQLLYTLCDWPWPGNEHTLHQDFTAHLLDLDGRQLGEVLVLTMFVEELSDGDTYEDLDSLGNSHALGLTGHYGICAEDLQRHATQEAQTAVDEEQQRRLRAAEGASTATGAFLAAHGESEPA
jgi:ParB/RepB/Spo0J family partition protein